MLRDKTILVTGGTGSFGNQCVKTLLAEHKPKKVLIFSRDELKQAEMMSRFTSDELDRLRFFIGDVRDKERLSMATHGVDVILHAAALKRVETAEYNPIEAIKTNVYGTQNVIEAAISSNVRKVILLSTDKAVNPLNLYGASKLCADKLFVAANSYGSKSNTKFSVVRYGNVLGSRGSVVPAFEAMKSSGIIKITDPQMTRFWLTLVDGVRFVLSCLEKMSGGEIFVPKIPSMSIVDMASTIAPGCKQEFVGIRPGEKLHEVMISNDDAKDTYEYDDYYEIRPAFKSLWSVEDLVGSPVGVKVPLDFTYASNLNDKWLTPEQLLAKLRVL